jgi:hypothetical protein
MMIGSSWRVVEARQKKGSGQQHDRKGATKDSITIRQPSESIPPLCIMLLQTCLKWNR